VRNLKISKVEADYGDAITIQLSKNVWVDHCDLSATREGDKDFYDGLVDLSHAADWVTISHTYFHDHVSTCVHPWGGRRRLTPEGSSPRDRWSATRTTTRLRTPARSV
jgi:hypothetical protein